MNISAALKALANGVNPETGEFIASGSIVNQPDAIRLLFTLSDELAEEPEKLKRGKPTAEERQQKNIAEGRPAKSNFPWTEQEKMQLEAEFRENTSLDVLSLKFGRSERAVAIQLEKKGLITAEQLLALTL